MAYIPSKEFFRSNLHFAGLTIEEAQELYGKYLQDTCRLHPHLTLEAAQEKLMSAFKRGQFRRRGTETGRLSSRPRIAPHIMRTQFPNLQGDIDAQMKALVDRAVAEARDFSSIEARRAMLEGGWDVNPFENKHTGQSAGVDMSQPFTQEMLEKAIREMREAGISHEVTRDRHGDILSVGQSVDLNVEPGSKRHPGIASLDNTEAQSQYPDGHDDPMSAIRDMCK